MSVSITDIFYKGNANFALNDEVSMKMIKSTQVNGETVIRHEWVYFTVARRRYQTGQWQYQLKDANGQLYTEAGSPEGWFAERRLE
jgi:hypothetical protein